MRNGWRRFGWSLFRPRCSPCHACRAIRVDAARFRPNRSQRRARKANERDVRLEIATPEFSEAKLSLYKRYHAYQTQTKDWPPQDDEPASSYSEAFLENPFPTEEWHYWLDDRLIGVGYVDALPGGLSGIYFYYEPTLRWRSLGIWNVQCLIDQAAASGLPHVYLGFLVEGCSSMAYKAGFVPNQVLGPDGHWHDFRT
jgi:arginine-tRNA-protein transferase